MDFFLCQCVFRSFRCGQKYKRCGILVLKGRTILFMRAHFLLSFCMRACVRVCLFLFSSDFLWVGQALNAVLRGLVGGGGGGGWEVTG